MAQIAGGFVMPHDPLIFAAPDAAPADQKARVLEAYAEIGRRIGALGATTAVIIGADHYILFGPGCLPAMLIGIGDVEGPIERLPGLDRGPLPTNEALARHLFDHSRAAGIDWAVAKALTVDHAIAIPHQLCVAPNPGVRTIPIYLNCGVEPNLPLARARQVGEALRRAVEAWPEDERVVVIGSGGISHWVGTAEMGRVNSDFDHEILARIERADLDGLAAYDDADLLERGGNGALEIRNFVCAMACVAPVRGRVIGYEPVPRWITGLGFAELEVA